MTVDQILADDRKMRRFICERIPPITTRVVVADGGEGPAWVDLTPLWDDEGDCDLVIEANEPDAFRLRAVYEHFRRQEMTGWEWERELAGEMNRWKLCGLERVMADLHENLNRSSAPNGDDPKLTDEELPKEVSTAEAARILGVSKDTVLKLKAAGLLEYRNTGSPDSCRPVYAFSLRSVLEVRTTYQRDNPPYHRPEAPHRHRVKGKRNYKHFTLSDD
jgi:hypothetical protein